MIITSTHYNRPDCTKMMIDSLLKCRKIEGYTLLFQVEPGFPEVLNEIEKYPLKKIVVVNTRLLGCWQNKLAAITTGFEHSGYVIHIEDDVLLARDALEYFEWAFYQTDLASVTAFSLEERFLNNPIGDRVGITKHYSPIAWATWREEFNKVRARWNGSDTQLQELWTDRNHLTPEVSRAKHIGTGLGIRSNKELANQLLKMGHLEKMPNKNELFVNVLNEEWSKLDDENVKSKCLAEYDKYNIKLWSDDLDRDRYDYYISSL